MINYLNCPLSDVRMNHPSRSDAEIAAAYHEAGHAVVMLGFGFRVSEVSIDKNGSGEARRERDVRDLGTSEQCAVIAAAGRAGEEVGPYGLTSHNRGTWIDSAPYSVDVSNICYEFDGATDAKIRDFVNTAKRCIQVWPGTFGRLVRALLVRGTLDEAEVLACIPDGEYRLRTHWQNFQEPETPAVSEPASPRSLLPTLEWIHQMVQDGKGIPPKVSGLLSDLERIQTARGTRFEPKPSLGYADDLPYQTRVKLPGHFDRMAS